MNRGTIRPERPRPARARRAGPEGRALGTRRCRASEDGSGMRARRSHGDAARRLDACGREAGRRSAGGGGRARRRAPPSISSGCITAACSHSFLGEAEEAEERLRRGLRDAADRPLRIVRRLCAHNIAPARGAVDDARRGLRGLPRARAAPIRWRRRASTSLRAGERPERPAASVAEGAAEVLYRARLVPGTCRATRCPRSIYLRLAAAPRAAARDDADHASPTCSIAHGAPRIGDRALRDRFRAARRCHVTAEIEIAHALERLERNAEAESRLRRLMAERPRRTSRSSPRSPTSCACASSGTTRSGTTGIALEHGRRAHLRRIGTLLYFRGAAYERAKQWPAAEADLKLALELVPETSPVGRAQVLNYPRLFLGRHGHEHRRGVRDAAGGGGALAPRRHDHRQPRLGLLPARPLRGRGARARAGGGAEAGRPRDQRPPRRRLLAGGPAAGGALPVAARAGQRPRGGGAREDPSASSRSASRTSPPRRPRKPPAAARTAAEPPPRSAP